MRIRAVVLAAGAGARFGGQKLEARIAGRPILQHVLDSLAIAGIDDAIVVLPPDSPLETSMRWRGAARVVNPEPERGLSSSLRLGWDAALAADPKADAILVALGDQPRLATAALSAVAGAAQNPSRPIVAARFVASGARNPVRIEIGAIADRLIAEVEGDRGLGPILDTRPELVRWVEIDGDNPDVDRPADLVAAIEADWADRVRLNREQVDRFREVPEDADHYAPVAGLFRDDPRRSGDAILDRLLEMTQLTDTWIDVGAGAGRYALPLALALREVIAVDPSRAMTDALRTSAREFGIRNVRIVDGRWPAAAADLAPLPCADVSLIANVGHDTEQIGPFVDALESAVRRACVAVMQEQPPAALAAPFFAWVHGEPRTPLPALPDFVDLLTARGTPPDLELFDRADRRWKSREELLTFLRRQTWVVPGSAGDRRLQERLDALLVTDGDGVRLRNDQAPARVGLVRWAPPHTSGASSAAADPAAEAAASTATQP